jgi:AbrB family looped-hinge helix DNA binding protein
LANRLDSLRQRVSDVVDTATARADELRARSTVVDRVFGVLNRERLIATSVLSAFVAFRMFVFLIPFAYAVVAALGLYGSSQSGGTADFLGDVGLGGAVAANMARAMEASDRGRWLALIVGLGAALWASLGLAKSVYAVHVVAWRLPRHRMRTTVAAVVAPIGLILVAAVASGAAARLKSVNLTMALAAIVGLFLLNGGLWMLASLWLPRDRGAPWTALIPGAALMGVGLQAVHIAVVFYFAGKLSRASEAYGALGIALVVLAWLFLIGRLAVAAADLNASLWEQRETRRAMAESIVRLDPDGRVALPRDVRDAWGIDAGDPLVIERDGGDLRIRPLRDPGSGPSEAEVPRGHDRV